MRPRGLRWYPCPDIAAKCRSPWADEPVALGSLFPNSRAAPQGDSAAGAPPHRAGPPERPAGAAARVAAGPPFRQCPAPLAAPLEPLPSVCRIATLNRSLELCVLN